MIPKTLCTLVVGTLVGYCSQSYSASYPPNIDYGSQGDFIAKRGVTHGRTANLNILQGRAGDLSDRPIVAQQFLDHRFDKIGNFPKAPQFVRVADKRQQSVAKQVGRRLLAGKKQQHRIHDQLGQDHIVDDRDVLRPWPRRVPALRLDNAGEILGQRPRAAFGEPDLVRRIRNAADEGRQVLRPGSELLHFGLRHPGTNDPDAE